MWIKSLNRLINSDQVQQFYCAENASGQGGGVIIVYQGGAFETFSEHATMEKAKETLGKLYRLLGQGSSVPPAETAAPVKEANDKEAKEAPPVPPVPLAPSPVRLKCESDCRNALANLDQSVIGAWHKYMEEAYGSAKVGEIAAENLEKLLDQLQNALREAATKAKHDKATAQGTNFQKTDFQKTDFQKTDFQKGAVAANPL